MPVLDGLMYTVTDFSLFQIPLLIIIAAAFIFGNWRLRGAMLMAVAAVLLADMIGQDLKMLFDRRRPYFTLEGVQLPSGGGDSKSPSFPSNHAVNTMAGAVVVAWHFRKKLWLAIPSFVFPAMVGLSRVYMGVHYPSDVLGGFLLGALVASAVIAVRERVPPVTRGEDKVWHFHWGRMAVLFVAIVSIYRFSVITRGIFPLSPEEAQYWVWSRIFDEGDMARAPMTLWMIRISTGLFGDSEFGVRAVAWLLAIAMSALAWRFVLEIADSARVAFFAVLALSVMPLSAAGAMLATAETAMMFFWVACVRALHLALFHRRRAEWIVAALLLGLGILCDYSMVYVVPCLFIHLALCRPHREWLRRPEPYLFAAITLLFLTPLLLWSEHEDASVFLHLLRQTIGTGDANFSAGAVLDYLVDQFAIVGPPLFCLMVFYPIAKWHRRELGGDARGIFLLSLGVPVYIGLLARSLSGEVVVDWAVPAYFTWSIYTVWMVERDIATRWPSGYAKALGLVAALGIAIPAFGFVALYDRTVWRMVASGASTFGIPATPRGDPAYRLLGYDDLGEWVTEARDAMPIPERTFLFAGRYQEAAEMSFYVEGQPRTYTPYFGGERTSFHQTWSQPSGELRGWDALLVLPGRVDTPRPEVIAGFRVVWEPVYLEIREKRKTVKWFTLFRCWGYRGEFPHAVDGDAVP